MAVFKTRGYKTFIFNVFLANQIFFFFLFYLTVAAFIKCGSSLPKAAFYRRSFKFGLKPRVENAASNT